ncbi:hypothetical protein PBY51_023433 [Eleginops maclovinus]|uniref:Ig-like domain-containing protein n=1 Tax=Eleginops maclovinus TaxID=56733 RepID=A0AAN7X2Z8_ELEMC|nr:hypothetical protein PBY51_023433 [Eleginops maclovinus]
MDWAVILVLHVMFQPSLSVLFTVEAERTMYESKFGEDVVMGCRFQPKLSNHQAALQVMWQWFTSTLIREVYHLDDWKQNVATQDPDYLGRVVLLTEELHKGWAKLKISRLRINDSGTYQCLVQTGEGADYKTTTLSVVAPYKSVTKHIEKAAGGDDMLLTCLSEGYPESPVMWQNGQHQTLSSNTTSVTTPEQLVQVTSRIRVRSSAKDSYKCIFTKDGSSATFQIPDEIPVPQKRNDALIVVLSIGVIIVALIIAMLFYRRQKGFRFHCTRNLSVDGQGKSDSVAACIAKNKDNEEEITIFNEGCMEENLGAFLKNHYSNFSLSTEMTHHCEAFAVEELPHRLQNNEGKSVSLQALLPKAGEVVFLEGSPGSGKTTVAHILVSSWTEGPTHALSKRVNLSTVRFLFTIDCNRVKGDFFQEIKMQLSLLEKTEDELRTLLTSEALLVLDGYREGNHFFDESLRKFVMEREGCRVLVMSCPRHCPILNDTVVTGRTLQIQNKV